MISGRLGIGCPHCKGERVIRLCNNRYGKQSYKCKDCTRRFMADTIHRVERLKPPCPHCGAINPKLYGKYKNNWKYLCSSCKRKYGESTALHTYPVKNLAIGFKKDGRNIKDIACEVGNIFNGTIHFSTIYRWALQASIPMQGGKKGCHKKIIVSSEQKRYEHERALVGNTRITAIDEMTRDTEVRQQAALECLIIGLENLSENEIKNIVSEVKRKKRNEFLKQKYSTVYLYEKARNSEDDKRLVIDTIQNDASLDPCDIVCGVGDCYEPGGGDA